MNEDLMLFIDEFGHSQHVQQVPEILLQKYSSVLPSNLIEFWRDEGWGSYSNGLLWTVNPEDYSAVLKQWTSGFQEFQDVEMLVFARSAFGCLYAIQFGTENVINIECPYNFIFLANESKKHSDNLTKEINGFFACADKHDFDIFDSSDRSLFDMALQKLGPLNQNEIYGFEPILAMNPDPTISSIRRCNLFVHLDILYQFQNPVLRIAEIPEL